jgi:DNA-binding MarR family transcriptional regulator
VAHSTASSDLGYVLGAVLRSYLKATTAVVEEIPGGPRGFQIVSAAVSGTAGSQSGLAQRLGIDRTVMTYLLDDLEDAGLVYRQQDPADRRHRRILATDEGRKLHDSIGTKLRAVEETVLAPLDPDEQATLRGLLCRVAAQTNESGSMDACEVVSDLAREDRASQRRRTRRGASRRG